MKKFLSYFFMTLGVIFFILILVGVYFYVTDPWGVKPLIFGTSSAPVSAEELQGGAHPLLSDEQEQALEAAGVDPATIPTEIPTTQEDCFVEKLGAERVAEIKAGAMPSALEIMKGKECVE